MIRAKSVANKASRTWRFGDAPGMTVWSPQRVLCAPGRALIVCLLMIIRTFSPHAQDPFVYSYIINETNGLPSDRVRGVAEDNDGFLWVLTNEGLARYDGSQVRIFRHNSNAVGSIIDNRGEDLLFDGEYLWVATYSGISRLDPLSGQFRNYRFDKSQCEMVGPGTFGMESVYDLHLEPDGTLWAGTRNCGFMRYVAEKDSFVCHQIDMSVLREVHQEQTDNMDLLLVKANGVISFVSDVYNDSILWVGSYYGLYRFNKHTGDLRAYINYHPDRQNRLDQNTYLHLFQDPNGIIYGKGWIPGLVTFDTRTETFGTLPSDDELAYNCLRGGLQGLYPASDSTLWITTSTGLVEYDFLHRSFPRFFFNDVEKLRLYGCHYRDREGRYYHLTIHGLVVYDPVQQQFALSSFRDLNNRLPGYVYSVTHDSLRNRYTACAREAMGLFHLDLATGQWTTESIPEKFYTSRYPGFNNLSATSSGDFILATYQNIIRYDPDKGTFSELPVRFDLTNRRFQDVFVDSRDIAWISTREDGVFAWNTRNSEMRRFTFPTAQMIVAASDTETFIEDSKGRIWMKRRDAYSIYDYDLDTLMHFTPPKLNICYNGTWAEDDAGRMWLANYEGFLHAIPIDSVEQGITITIRLGDENNTLLAMARGPDGNLWCATKSFLLKLNPQTLEQQRFSYAYGENPNEFFSMQFMHNGSLVFGKRSALVSADPFRLFRNELVPQPYISSISIGEKPLASDTMVNKIHSLSLDPEENFFTIGFSAVGLTNGRNNQIQYRLAGFQDNWSSASDLRIVNYTNVPSGDYTFELKAYNNEGIQNPEIFILPIHIGTPWYKTWWAVVLALLIMAGLIYSVYRYQVAQVRKEERLRTDYQKRLAEVEMSALRAQMNPHFIFNCLNSIENYVIKNETLKASVYLNDFARLIRLILQNSRSKYITLEDEIEALELYMKMESLRFINKFNYTIDIDESVEMSNLEIPPMLIQPYIENAIWHGLMPKDSPGHLKITVSRDNGMIHCTIEDDGIGRERSEKIKEQKTGRKRRSMGMSITNERINILNKFYNLNTHVEITDLKNENGDPAGTRVSLSIPV